jgi:transcriptional regulator
MNYQQLRQQGAAQQAAANRDKATLQNQSVISQKDIDMKKYIADQQADTSLFDTLIPW